VDKEKDPHTYQQLLENFYIYANVDQMAYCIHPFDTQTNETLNKAITNVAPKSISYSSAFSLFSRIALVIGIHKLGHLVFFHELFDRLGITMGETLLKFLQNKQKTKETKKYKHRVEVKIGRGRQQKKERQKIFVEHTDNSYGVGVPHCRSEMKVKGW
jgi:hypothetical protein